MAGTAKQILVTGVVQMVGYRAWTRRTALALGVTGFVKNLEDGRVEIFAEGEAAAVDALLAACWRGPTHAEVSNVEQEAQAPRGYTDFIVA